jgi:GNAT superfamily N-acetyltransferase
MSRITIRPLTRRHGTEFLSLVDALADYEKLKRPTRAARTRLLRDALGGRGKLRRKKRFDTFLAFKDGRAVGYAIVFETYSSFRARPTLFLEDLFVLPEYRKQRIGLKLFRRCVAEARGRGCGRMEWIVLDWNQPAIRFYKKLKSRRMREWLLFRIDVVPARR